MFLLILLSSIILALTPISLAQACHPDTHPSNLSQTDFQIIEYVESIGAGDTPRCHEFKAEISYRCENSFIESASVYILMAESIDYLEITFFLPAFIGSDEEVRFDGKKLYAKTAWDRDPFGINYNTINIEKDRNGDFSLIKSHGWWSLAPLIGKKIRCL